MTKMLATYLCLIGVWLVWIMIRDHRRGLCDLVSVRNAAIVGFIIFQLTSAALSLWTGEYGLAPVTNPTRVGFEYAVMVSVFVPLTLFVYSRGWVANGLARRVPELRSTPIASGLIVLAIACAVGGIVLKFGVRIPLVSNVAGAVAAGLTATSAGLVGWVWAKRSLNPGLLFVTIAIVAAALLVSMVGSFGRRPLVAVGAALVWGVYYSSWRALPFRQLVHRLALIAIIPVLVLSLYTSVRGATREASSRELMRELLSGGQVVDGLKDVASGQLAGAISMWLIENYPERFEYRHLNTVIFFSVYAVPRAWWPDKPQAMSVEFPALAGVTKVAPGFNVGPGIIGLAASEGGWYALLLYGILGGIFLRFFDEVAARQRYSPLIIIAMGAAVGQFVGLARGETSSFAFNAVMTVFGTAIFMMIAAKLLEGLRMVDTGYGAESESSWQSESTGEWLEAE